MLRIVVGGVAGLVVCWLALVVVLWRLRPRESVATEALRAIPDVIRLVSRLARNRSLPRRLRVWLWLLAGYLALPFDIVPDFIPVIGFADDAIVVAVALRAVVRQAGREAVAAHWPGTPDGLRGVERLAGIS